MIHVLLLFFLGFTLLFGETKIEKKIENSKNVLKSTKNEQTMTNLKLNKVVGDIKVSVDQLDQIEEKIKQLNFDEGKVENEYARLKKALKNSTATLKDINKEMKTKEDAFINAVTKQLSITFALEQMGTPTQESIILQELFKSYKDYNDRQMQTLQKDIVSLEQKKENTTKQGNSLKQQMSAINKEQIAYLKRKETKELLLKRLNQEEEKYQGELEKIIKKQSSLRETLSKLKILQVQEVEEEKKAEEARKKAMKIERERKAKLRIAKEKERKAKIALANAKNEKEKKKAEEKAKLALQERTKVEQVSQEMRDFKSSYKAPKTAQYKGTKAISPMKGGKVVKRFGTYYDPLYHIKIYNESIVIKAPQKNTIVKNVLNGEIVYIGTSSMLGKVVVVAHSNKLHTIYAGLSSFGTTLKQGTKLKQGGTIGKVNSKLTFEATQNSQHIDPLTLISL